MIENLEEPFSYAGQKFCAIARLGFNTDGKFIVDGHTTPFVAAGEPRGGYLTCPPISGRDFRKAHGTRAAFSRVGNRFTFYDEYGRRHVIEAGSSVLDTLVCECKENDVPEIAEVEDARR